MIHNPIHWFSTSFISLKVHAKSMQIGDIMRNFMDQDKIVHENLTIKINFSMIIYGYDCIANKSSKFGLKLKRERKPTAQNSKVDFIMLMLENVLKFTIQWTCLVSSGPTYVIQIIGRLQHFFGGGVEMSELILIQILISTQVYYHNFLYRIKNVNGPYFNV